jgi:SAM-dependent methyltransferase
MPIAYERIDAILAANGYKKGDDITTERLLELIGDDPAISTTLRTWLGGQQLIWSNIQAEFHDNADAYLAEMEAADNAGPGSLELNPDLEIPDYARHEIHIQPGGYVGDPFAGHINHYGVNAFYAGRNYQDEVQLGMARGIPGPADGQVRRILDIGCATGRLTYAMKQKYPEAEVWGIDVGGPMVRYAHMRALDIGVECHFAQRLAEDNRFPDNHFDMVVSYILFHEVPQEITQRIIAETYRVLRPGGVFFPIDFATGDQARKPTPQEQFSLWWDHRWNNEVWRPDFTSRDFGDSIAAAGFDVDETVPSVRRRHGGVLATKPA